MTDSMHFTEEERQTFADGSMTADRATEAESHLDFCSACADDVARLRRLMTSLSNTRQPIAPTDDLWPSIREQIEHRKVVPLAGSSQAARSFTRHHFAMVAALVAAGVAIAILLRPSRDVPKEESVAAESPTAMIAVIDSTTNYEEEARTLLNRLELHRAFLRPEATAAIDRDLRAIDGAISELRIAIQENPRDPALRRLLAQSYRHKIEVLKKSDNAD